MLTRSEHLNRLRSIEAWLKELRLVVGCAVRSGSVKHPNSEIGIVRVKGRYRLCVSMYGNDVRWTEFDRCTDYMLSLITRDAIVRLRECILESKVNMIAQLESATDDLNFMLSRWESEKKSR